MKKIFTLLFAFIALATVMQATDYGFSIRGYRITSDNYQSMSTSAWSYDPAANVLHLKDGTINSDAVAIAIHSNNPTLNVSVDGNCELYGKFDSGIIIAGGNHTFSGNGTLSIRSSVVSSTGISAGENSNTNVTFKDLSVSIKQYGGIGFNTSYFASITFEHCDFDINTSDGMAMMTTNTSACTPHLILCNANRSWGANNGWYGYRGQGANEGPFAPNVKITRAIKYVGVNVAEPVPGQKPVTTATTISSGYKVLSVEWKKKIYGNFHSLEANEVIQLGETYQVSFDLEAQGDSIFNWDSASEAAMTFTVNGNTADFSTVTTERRAYMEYTFPELVGTKYNLWVGGVQVNDANKDDVLGNGYVSYNPATSTLTLKGGTIKGNNTDSSANFKLGCGIYSEVDGLTIDVQGNTTVQGDYEKSYDGIDLHLNTTITGTAQLTAKGHYGIIAGHSSGLTNLTIGGNVTVVAEGTGSCGLLGLYRYFKGVYTYYATLTIKDNSTVMAKGATNTTSLGSWQDFTLAGSHEITAPSGAKWNATTHNICYADGTAVKGEWVVIKRLGALKGDVNLDGDVTIADGVAVLNAMAGQSVPGNPDINGDNDITIADFVAVLNIMAGQ